jgi:pimeloyl-ACP methyl ester carboxylesterase
MNILNEAGYPTIGQSLPSVGASPGLPSFDEDVSAIRNCLTKLIEEEEKDVILVMHSYSGMPGTEAPVGLGKKEREQKALNGGVVRLVYIMAYAMPEGFSPGAGGAEFPAWMRMDLENGLITVKPEDAISIFYNDLPHSEATKWAARLVPQSLGVVTSIQTYAAWRHIPSTFIIGTQDKSNLSPEMVRGILEQNRQFEAGSFDVVEEVDAGHCLMLGRPEWLAGALRRAAGEKV